MADVNYYKYTPSLAAGVLFTIIFSLLTMYHSWCLLRTRTWFCIPFVVGGLFETIGYITRAKGNTNPGELSLYIIQSLLLLVAPILFAASIYMILARIIKATKAEADSLVRVNWLTRIFVLSDVVCFLVQCGGGGLQATGNASTANLGQNIVLAGLVLQIVIFCFFLTIAAVFHHRLVQRPTAESLSPDVQWKRLMWTLYAVSLLITARNLVRVVEYGTGRDGYLLTHEWALYVFDAVPMGVALATNVTWYKSNLTRRAEGDFSMTRLRVRKSPEYQMKANP